MKMRKSLWMIPVLLLVTAMGTTAAHADTIQPSNTAAIVSEIDGVTIGTTTYNVTFATTDTAAFATDPTSAAAMAVALLHDLNTVDPSSKQVSTTGGSISTENFFYDGGDGNFYYFTYEPLRDEPFWVNESDGVLPVTVADAVANAGDLYANFTPVATPEPSSLSLMLMGLVALGTLAAVSARKPLGQSQSKA